jgi:hypothetical protein
LLMLAIDLVGTAAETQAFLELLQFASELA